MTTRKHASSTTAPPIQAAACAGIHEGIVALVHGARHAAARSVNALMASTYWELGVMFVRSALPRSTMAAMQVATGTVVNGKIIVEGVPLREGALVAVLARGADEPFSLSAAQEEELVAAMAEIQRGEFVTLEQLLAELPQ